MRVVNAPQSLRIAGCVLLLLALQWRLSSSAFNEEQCAAINANGSCQCNQTKSGGNLITCVGNQPNSAINLYVNPDPAVELDCDVHALDTPDVVAKMPQLDVGAVTDSLVSGCVPFADIFARIGVQPQQYFELRVGGASDGNVTRQLLSVLKSVSRLKIRGAIRLAEDAFADLENLYELHLSVERLALSTALFRPLVSLHDLTISANLTHLPTGIFPNFRRLRTLDLRSNHFRSLNQRDLGELPMLNELYLGGNEIEFLSGDAFAGYPLLKRLSLVRNRLRQLPPNLLARQTNLRYLGLNGNQLMSLPPELFATTTALQELMLSMNHLTRLDPRTFASLGNLITLSLSDNRLQTILPGTFAPLRKLRMLYLSNNQIHMPADSVCPTFAGLSALQQLDLSHNLLTAMCADDNATATFPTSLETLNLSNNTLTKLSVGFMRALNGSARLRSLSLLLNPWACDCEAGELLSFIKGNRKRITDVNQLACADPRLPKFIELNFYDMCVPEVGVEVRVVVVTLSLFAIGLLTSSTALLYYKYRLEIRIWLYAHELCLCCVTEQELDKEKRFDAFISYSHKDEKFIAEQLLPGLENGPTPFKVCIHLRDWLVGAFIPEQIVDSVEQSRRTIIVLSQNFIESDWALMEFRTAHQCSLNEGRARIILIIYGDITDTESLYPELQAYLKMNTYLKWDDPWFWDKLRYAMPHSTPRTRRTAAAAAAFASEVASNDISLEAIQKS